MMVTPEEGNQDRVRRECKYILATCAIERRSSQQTINSTSVVGTGSLVRDFFPNCDTKVHLITSEKVIPFDADLRVYFLRFKKATNKDKKSRVPLSEVSKEVMIKSPGLAVIPLDSNKFGCIRKKRSGLLNHRPFTIYSEELNRDGSELICYVVHTPGKSFYIVPLKVRITDEETYLTDLNSSKINADGCFYAGSVWRGCGAPITMKHGKETVAVGAITYDNNKQILPVLFSEIDRERIASDERVAEEGEEEQPADEQVEGREEQPSDEQVEGREEQPSDQQVEGREEQPSDEQVEEREEQPSDEQVEGREEQPSDEQVEGREEQPSDEQVEGREEQPSDEQVEGREEQPSDERVEGREEQPSDERVEGREEQPSDEQVEGREEQPSDQQVEDKSGAEGGEHQPQEEPKPEGKGKQPRQQAKTEGKPVQETAGKYSHRRNQQEENSNDQGKGGGRGEEGEVAEMGKSNSKQDFVTSTSSYREERRLPAVQYTSVQDKREEGGGDKEQPQGQLSDGGEGPPLRKSALDKREGGEGEQQSQGKRAEKEKEQENCTDQGSSSGDNDKNSSLSSLSGSHQGPACSNCCSLSKRVAGDHTKRRKQHKSDSASKDINGHGKTPHKSSESLKSERLPLKEGERGEEGSEEQSSEDKQRNCSDQGLSSGDNDKNSSLSSLSGSYQGPASRNSRSLSKRVAGDHTKRKKQHKSDLASKDINGRGKTPLKSSESLKKKRQRVSLREGGPTEPYHITVTAHREALCGKSVTLQCETRGNIREARAKWGKEEKDVGGSPGTSSEGLDLELKKNGVRATVTGKIQQCNISEKLELEVCKNEARAWTTMADTEQDHCNVNNQQDSDSEQEETSESSEEPQEESLQGDDIQPPGKTGEQRKKQPPGDLLERATSGGATGRTQSEERGEVNGERQPQEESPQEEDKQPLGETGEGGKQQHLGDLLEGATSRGTTGRTQSEQRGESSSEQLQSVEGGKEQPPGKTGEGGQPAVGGVEQPPGETAEGGEEQPPGDVLDVAASRGTAGRKLEERGEVNGERQPQEESPQGEEKQPSGETGEGGKQQPPRDLLEGATSRGTTGRTQSALHLVKSREVYSQEKIMDQDNYKPKIVAGRLKTLPNYSAPLPESLRTTCVGEYLENCGNYSGYMQDSSSSSGGADSSSVKELEPRRRKKIQKRIQKRNARHSKAPSSAALSCDVVQSACSQQQVKVTPDNYPSNITVHAENVVIGDSTELNILRQRPPGIGSFDITIDPPEISLKGGGPCLFWFIPDLPSDISSGTAKFFGLHQGFVKLERVKFGADCLVGRGIPSAEKEGWVTVGVVGKNDKTGKCNDLGQAKIYYYDERRNVLKQIVQNEEQRRDFFETWKTAYEGHSTAGRVPKTESPSSDAIKTYFKTLKAKM